MSRADTGVRSYRLFGLLILIQLRFYRKLIYRKLIVVITHCPIGCHGRTQGVRPIDVGIAKVDLDGLGFLFDNENDSHLQP